MNQDKLLHIALGMLTLVFAVCGLFVLNNFGQGWFFAFSTTAVGICYELNQYVRKEGCVEIMDAVATASLGWIALVFLEFF